MKAIWIVWITIRCILYVMTHPRWSLRVWRGYRQYVKEGGSFLDTDFYKIPMGQVLKKYFSHVGAKYVLTLRTKVAFPEGFAEELKRDLEKFAANHSSITPKEAAYLRAIPFLDDDHIAYLENRSQPKIYAEHVTIRQAGCDLDFFVEGPAHQVSPWEIYAMERIPEIYNKMTGTKPKNLDWIVTAWRNGLELKRGGAIFSEFGTRRRFSFWVQFVVILMFIVSGAKKGPKDKSGLVGTSNVFLARLFGLTPIGTMAHELFMIAGAVYGYEKANKLITALWRKEFGYQLGYYLPDTYTSQAFFDELTVEEALHTTGPRQDSGDPFKFTDQTIKTYKGLGLTAKWIRQKTIIFSDSLNVVKALQILAYAIMAGIGAAFGIGTFFSNNVGLPPFNMVIKAYQVWLLSNPADRRYCIKISDDEGKITGDRVTAEQFIHYLKTGEILWTPLLTETPIEID